MIRSWDPQRFCPACCMRDQNEILTGRNLILKAYGHVGELERKQGSEEDRKEPPSRDSYHYSHRGAQVRGQMTPPSWHNPEEGGLSLTLVL